MTSSLGSYSQHQYQHQLNTPISAISMASSHLTTTQHTPSSAIQPYNPQEWVASPAQSVDHQHRYAGEVQGTQPPCSCSHIFRRRSVLT